MRYFLVFLILILSALPGLAEEKPQVAVMQADMMILPGTAEYLKASIRQAEEDGAAVLIVKLDTPGGMLPTTQQMIQEIFNAPLPVVVYVTPTGATATSAGVFITLAAHVAAMAPGTSIGAAHPVTGEGEDIKGDMRAKAENMTVAMVKAISEERGRNTAWAEKAIRESNSITEKEALKLGAIDLVAEDIDSLLKQLKGRKVQVGSSTVELPDLSQAEKKHYQISFKQKTLNVLANPSVLALLWLGATTGLSIELYNPGAILPGVVGVICLIAALAVSQVIPISQAGLILLIVGALMIGSEFFVTSGVLGIGGIVAMVLGSIYLVDTDLAPGLYPDYKLIIPAAAAFGGFMLFLVYKVIESAKTRPQTGREAMIGKSARALQNFSQSGKVFVEGEVWNAELSQGLAEKDEMLRVTGIKDRLVLTVEKIK